MKDSVASRRRLTRRTQRQRVIAHAQRKLREIGFDTPEMMLWARKMLSICDIAPVFCAAVRAASSART